MINISFNRLYGEGFQSIGQAELNFKDLGLCYVKGINKYDKKTESNGSGKSSLFQMLHWVIFGKTTNGISNDVINKFSDSGCYVELDLNIDNVNYVIKRYLKHKQYKTGLIILKDSEDISGRNKTDSDKIIKDLFKLDENTFQQMIFLSQGFSNRFAAYSPKDRRDLLESLYNIDDRLNDFINTLKNKESDLINNIYNVTKSCQELEVKNEILNRIINENNDKINKTKELILNLKNTKSNVTKEDIDILESTLNDLNSKIDVINNKLTSYSNDSNDILNKLSNYKSQKTKYELEIKGFSNNKVCPYCGTLLENYENNEYVRKRILELKEEILNIDLEIEKLNKKYDNLKDVSTKINEKLLVVKKDRDCIKNDLINKSKLYEIELQKDTQITLYKNNINECLEFINNTQDEIKINLNNISVLNDDIKNKSNDLNVIKHIIKLSNNEFRSYLLYTIINLLNDKLREMSNLLFENEIIKISGDSKLDIFIGDKTYEQCSGGEKRRCDISIIIAQRTLAQEMNTVSSNILICDEIFDGLDNVSFNIVLDLLMDELQDVESTFILSHRDIKDIPFDNTITIVKDENQVSRMLI